MRLMMALVFVENIICWFHVIVLFIKYIALQMFSNHGFSVLIGLEPDVVA